MSVRDEQIMAADRQGDLDRAVALASQQILRTSMSTGLDQRARRYIRFSWMLRHRGLGDDLSRSRDAAAQAVRLASLPSADPALLPLAKLPKVEQVHVVIADLIFDGEPDEEA